jgi:hypothetical protein
MIEIPPPREAENMFDALSKALQFCADLLTVILGVAALVGLICHRKKISLLFSVITNNFLSERLRRIRDTLSKLESSNFENKEERKEIRALFGQVCGQVKPLVNDSNGLTEIYAEIEQIVRKEVALSETVKRKVVSELNGRLDGISLDQTTKILD